MSLSIGLIKADIKTARNNISPFVNLSNDELMYNIAAYHAQQATEKCLKIMLSQYYGMDENDRRFKIHNIAGLIGMLDDFSSDDKPIPIEISDIIKLMSAEITSWESSSRYNDNIVVLRKNIKIVLAECKKMVADLKRKGFH